MQFGVAQTETIQQQREDMFTGLVEETGVVRAVRPQGGGRRLTIEARRVMDDLKIDDSVAVNGCCQTVVARTETTFDVEAIEETLAKTTLGEFAAGRRVNLERAMQLGGRLGGHLVQGHVDCRGTVLAVEELSTSHNIHVEFPAEFARYVIPVGSICIDGISLTVARRDENRLMVSIIPHTWKETTIGELRPGAAVNLEFDLVGKYVESIMAHAREPQPPGLTAERLTAMGYGR